LLSNDGQQLIDDGSLDGAKKEEYDAIDAGQARKEDLFRYGTVGKVIGVQRRAYAEPFLVVQGVQRFTIKHILRERPFFEAEVVLQNERGWCTDLFALKLYSSSQLMTNSKMPFRTMQKPLSCSSS
jgi:ATP-dependent Lon protease